MGSRRDFQPGYFMTTIYLIRHGHTASNQSSSEVRMSGWTDLPLSSLGREQVWLLRQRLIEEGPFCALYFSPLIRARRTAEMLVEACSGPFLSREDLREINCGAADGLVLSEVQRLYASEWAANEAQDNPHFCWPEGETYFELRERSVAALEAISAMHPNERVLVVTHAGVIAQIAGHIQGLSPARWMSYRAGNASVSLIEWSGSNRKIVQFDDRSHLRTLETRATG
jgi:broad specificity phosphatase PhoE